MATNTELLQQLYVAYFNRPADPGGLNYWLNVLNGGASITVVSDAFSRDKEYTDLFAGKAPDVIIDTIYMNLFGRHAEQGGLDYWGGVLASNSVSMANIVKAIAGGAISADGTPNADGLAYNNKVSAATAFYAEITTVGNEAERQAYASGNATMLAAVKGFLSGVTTDASLVAAQAGVHAFGQSLVSIVTPTTSTNMTTGADTLFGTVGNDTFNAAEAAGPLLTWTVGDTIDGGAGVDTLNIVQTAAIGNVLNTSVKNVEIANLISGATGTNVNATTWGLTNLNITAPGAVTATATATTAVSVVDAVLAAAAVTVNGGSTVNVTTTSVGTGSTVAVGGTTAATGAVVVNTTTTMADGAAATTATGTATTVTGGTNVTVNATLVSTGGSDNPGDALTGGAILVTGDATTTAVTVTQTDAAALVNGAAGSAAIIDGQVQVIDKNSGSATAAGTIKTVTLAGFGGTGGGASVINSGALETVNLSGVGADLTITTGNLTTPVVNKLALNVNGLDAGTITVDGDIATLNVNASTAASAAAVSAAGVTALNVAGNAALTVAQTMGALTSVTVTNTAGVTLSNALATGTTFTGGAGADTITLADAFTKAITLGAGDDVLNIVDTNADGVLAGTGGSVDAGAGTDTIALTAATAGAVSLNSTFNSKFTGFEVVDVTATTADATVNLAGINGVNQAVAHGIGAGNTLILNGFTSGGTLTLNSAAADAATSVYAANVTNAVLTPTDTFNVKLSNATGGALSYGDVQLAGIETVNINLVDAGTSTADKAATIDALKLEATSATKIVVAGNNGLTLVNTGNAAVTSFDASGVKADGTADTAVKLGVTFVSANTTTTATVTIIGGEGNDVLTGSAAKDVITGGKGSDIITGGNGVDTLNVGVGHDILVFNSTLDVTAPGASSDSTTAAFDTVSGFKTAAAITAATDLSDMAKFVASTAGGVDASLLNLSLLADDAGAGAGAAVAVSVQGTATAAGAAAGVTYSISTKGLLTLSGTGAAAVDTLAEWIAEANNTGIADGKAIAFQFGADTYVFVQNGAQDLFIDLAGVTSTGLVLVGGATTAAAGDILIGSALA